MRVAMIIQSYYPRVGGAERQVDAVSRWLLERDVDVHVVTRRYPGMSAFEVLAGVPVHRMPVSGPKVAASLAYTLASLRMVQRLSPDVLHAHELFSPTTTALVAKRLWGVPVLATSHLSGIDGEISRLQREPLGPARLRAFSAHIDAFTAISREIVAELVAGGVDEDRCYFIPNGVDVDSYRPALNGQKMSLRVELGLPVGPLAVFSGRLVQAKRVDRLLRVWTHVRREIPSASLVIVGEGSQGDWLRQQAGEGVLFVGRQGNVLPFLQTADLFTMSSDTEGLPVAVLEAMAVGLPSVVTAVGGNPDVIETGYNGWLAPADDELALGQAIIRLLRDEPLRLELGRNARIRAMGQYSLQSSAQSLLDLYVQLMTSPRRWSFHD